MKYIGTNEVEHAKIETKMKMKDTDHKDSRNMHDSKFADRHIQVNWNEPT